MGDCSSAEMRDALPELMFDDMDAKRRADVHAHVATCADCMAELELLKRVRRSAGVPSVDVDRVVRALPAPGRRRTFGFQSASLRMAAALALLIGGATWYSATKSEPLDQRPATQVAVAGSEGRDSSPVSTAIPEPAVTRGEVKTTSPAKGISLDGGLSDFSDAELRSLLASLDSFESTVAVEPEGLEPVIGLEEVR